MIVRSLLTSLGFQVNESQLTKYQRATNNIKSSAEGAAESFRNMFVAFAGFSALRSLANTADEMQSLEARIGLLPQTIGLAADSFDEIAKKASESRASISAYGTLYVRLAGATSGFLKTQSEVLEVTSAISDALVVGGAVAQEAASAMLQLSQGFQKGKLDGDEFRAFMETMSTGVKEALAEALGANSVGDLFDMSSNGKLTAKNLAAAFKKIGPEIRKQMLQIPLTIGQATTLMGNRWDEFVNRINRKSGAVTKVAEVMVKSFDLIENKLNDLVDFFGGATQTLKFFAIAITALVLPALVKLGVGFVALLASPAGIFVAILLLLLLVLEDVYQYFTGGISLLGKMDAWVRNLTIGLGIFTAAIALFGATAVSSFLAAAVATAIALAPLLGYMAILSAIAALIFVFADNFKDAMALIVSIFTGDIDGMTKAFKSMVDRFMGYWNSFKSFFGMGVSTTISASTASGAASSAGGVPTAGGTSNVTINQTLPAGSPEATKVAAREGAKQALDANPMDKAARQMAQAQ